MAHCPSHPYSPFSVPGREEKLVMGTNDEARTHFN